jgi:acetolactate synthase-1/2/3 large subunit
LLARAFTVALEGRPGPVLLDIPMDVQGKDISAERLQRVPPPPEKVPESVAVADLLAALKQANRPLILAGGGIRSARSAEAFRAFVGMVQVPVVHSLLGIDALPFDSPLHVGLIGSYGNRWANHAIGRSDFMLVLGSRLDIRQTGAQTEAFKEGRTIYHVDCDRGELNNRVLGCITIESHLRPFFAEALRQTADQEFALREEWLAEIRALRAQWPDTAELNGIEGINPNEFMHRLSQVSHKAAAFVIDVGQHQMWAAQSLEIGSDQRFITSGGMGAMGFALPAAVGVGVSQPERPLVLVAGDGGFQLNIQELQTIVRNQLPVKMVVLDNRCHGMVRQFQETYFEARYQSTYWGYSAPDFARVAQAYGIDSCMVAAPQDVADGLKQLWLIQCDRSCCMS